MILSLRDPNELQRAVEGAAAALARSSGVPVQLVDVVSLADDERRNLILRATAIRPDAAAQSVILKATRAADHDPAALDAFEKSGLVKEWTATAYLTGHAPGRGHSPTFVAGDATLGLLVFEDLGATLGSLVGPLRTAAPPRPSAGGPQEEFSVHWHHFTTCHRYW